MKKRDQKRLDEALDKALAPPKQRPRQNLDALLDEYDDRSQSLSKSIRDENIPESIPSTIPKGIPNAIPASVPDEFSEDNAPTVPVSESTPAKVQRRRVQQAEDEEPSELTQELTAPLDATHTVAEKVVYSIMYRETISKGTTERHFGPSELMKRTGIRSRNTVHKALYGLVEKLSVEVVDEARGNPLGPRYRVHRPQVIEQRRKNVGMKIDPQSKRIVGLEINPDTIPETIPATIPEYPKNWDSTIPKIGIVGIPKIGIVIKNRNKHYVETYSATASSSIGPGETGADDEAFAVLVANLRRASSEVAGREPSAAEAERWGELSELLVTELKIAAGRTGSVSSVPAFLTEHLRRRLWKTEKRQLEAAGGDASSNAPAKTADASLCPDCFGTGMWYPEGYEKGVARCAHEKLGSGGADEENSAG